MAFGDRKSERVTFDRGIKVRIFAIDGAWQRECLMSDVSDSGARLTFDADFSDLDLKEFFLALSASGLAYRRCKLVRTFGNQVGVRFVPSATSPR